MRNLFTIFVILRLFSIFLYQLALSVIFIPTITKEFTITFLSGVGLGVGLRYAFHRCLS